jgi:hypothetical protein
LSYADKKLELEDGTLTIRQYYFPTRSAKRVRLSDIDHVGTYDMGPWTGRYRFWGSGDLQHWFNNDFGRVTKTKAFILYLRNGFVRPVVTPDRPEEFRQELNKAGIRLEPARMPWQPTLRST